MRAVLARAAPLAHAASNASLISLTTCPRIQTKLNVGPVDDPLEREADRVADAVVSGRGAPGTIQRNRAVCEEEENRAMRNAAGRASGAMATPSAAGSALNGLPNLGSGSSLPAAVRAAMEFRFGRSFADVRIHTDAYAAISAAALNASAYTLGSDIAFALGQYRPYHRDGQRLLAHELTHVMQQASGISPLLQRQPGIAHSRPASWPKGPTREDPLMRQHTNAAQWQAVAKAIAKDPNPYSHLPVRTPFEEGMVADGYRRGFSPTWMPKEAEVAGAPRIDGPIGWMSSWTGYFTYYDLEGNVSGTAETRLESTLSPIDFIPIGLVGTGAKLIGQKLVSVAVRHIGRRLAPRVMAAVIKGTAEAVPVAGTVTTTGATTVTSQASRQMMARVAPQLGKAELGQAARGAVRAPVAATPTAPAAAATVAKPAGAAIPTVSAAARPSMDAAEQAVHAWAQSAASSTAAAASRIESPIRGPEIFEELSRELGTAPSAASQSGSRSQNIQAAVRDAEAAGFTRGHGPGTVDLATQPHGAAPNVRTGQGVAGATHQSAHIGPTSFLRGVSGYSRSAAETVIMPRAQHAAFDAFWKNWAMAQRRAGRVEVKVQELYNTMLQAIDQTPGLQQLQKNALAWRLELELFRDLGLRPEQSVTLPYANIAP